MTTVQPGNACPHCGGDTESAFTTGDINRRVDDSVFTYWRCRGCGLIFLRDPPSDLARYYPDDYYAIARSLEELTAWSRSERYKLDIVSRFRRSGHLVEIGPASGAFAYLAKVGGYDVTAIEMDSRCCEYLASELRINVIQSAEEAKALETVQPADVIAMWHVIEHLSDPWRMLEVAAGKLKPGGILVLAAPNPEAWQFGLFRDRWTHVDAPRHLWLIPAKVVAQRGEALGLTLRLQTTRDQGSLYWNRFGWERSFSNMCTSHVTRKLALLAGRVAAAAASIVESREGRGSAYTMVLEKRVP